jgi:hypothetical protein
MLSCAAIRDSGGAIMGVDVTTIGAWLRANRGLVITLAVTVVSMVSTYLSTHQIFPDTQYYLAWTYRLMGYPDAESERLTIEYIHSDGLFEPYSYLWGSPLELSTKPRLLVPLLSIPFVYLFGPGGIVVVPGLALLVAVYLIYRFASLWAGELAVTLACCLMVLAPPVMRWSLGGLTDSAALLLHVLMLVNLPWRKAPTWRSLVVVGLAAALTSTARIITPFTVAAMAVLWLWAMRSGRDRRGWTKATVAAAAGAIAGAAWTKLASAGLTAQMYYYIMSNNQISGLRDLPRWYWQVASGYVWDELIFISFSPTLILLIGLSLAACWLQRRTVIPWLVAGGWLGALGLFFINPSPTEFRYELPMLPALVAAAAVVVTKVLRALPTPAGSADEAPLVRVIRQGEHGSAENMPGHQVVHRRDERLLEGLSLPGIEVEDRHPAVGVKDDRD